MAGISREAGTAYPSRALGFNSVYWWGPFSSSFLWCVFCVLLVISDIMKMSI
jgi:hypothetical protein